VPSSVELLRKHGWNVRVERDAGTGAKFRDRDYEMAGAEIVSKENAFASGPLLSKDILFTEITISDYSTDSTTTIIVL